MNSWNIEIITALIASGLFILNSGVLLVYFAKKRYRYLLWFALYSASWAIWGIFRVLSFLYQNIFFHQICVIGIILSVNYAVLIYDTIARESIDPWKILFSGILSGIVFVFLFQTGNIVQETNELQGTILKWTGNLEIFGIVLILYGNFFLLLILLKIMRYTPKSLRKYRGILALGMVLMIVVTFSKQIPGLKGLPGIESVLNSVISLLSSLVLLYQPKLAFILPFRVSRLTIIQTESGIPLFTYKWSAQENLVDDTLFSGMLQGISMFVKESLHRGNLKEIQLDNGYLMIDRLPEIPIAVILITTHPTRTLRNALHHFAKQFVHEYEPYLVQPSDVSPFNSAGKLVENTFSFIPE